LKYIKVCQAYDKKKLYELQTTKVAYNEQNKTNKLRQDEAEEKLSKRFRSYRAAMGGSEKAKTTFFESKIAR